jgi:hypothetical protein
LEQIIEPVMADHPDFKVQRADKLSQPGLIDAQVINALLAAELVIADLSWLNPNAFYEIGIRHMRQKPIIHMQLSDQKPPFDVSLYRAIKFSLRRPSDLTDARDKLRGQVAAVLADDYEVENPVTNARGRLNLDQHATPDQRVILEQMRGIQERLAALEAASTANSAISASNLTGLIDQVAEGVFVRGPPLFRRSRLPNPEIYHTSSGSGGPLTLRTGNATVDPGELFDDDNRSVRSDAGGVGSD